MESYDSIFEHLSAGGAGEQFPDRLRGDLDELMVRYERFISRPNRRGLVEISPYLEALLHPSARHGVAIPAELCRNTTVVMAISPATRGIGTGGVGLPRPNL